MALIPKETYEEQTIGTDINWPLGKARNDVVEDDGLGTPLEAEWVNDIWGFLQALLAAGGVTPTGDPDSATLSQYLEALRVLIANVDRNAQVFGNLGVVGTISVMGSVSAVAELISGGNGTINGNLHVGGKINGPSGRLTVDNELLVEGPFVGTETHTGTEFHSGSEVHMGSETHAGQAIFGNLLVPSEIGPASNATLTVNKCYFTPASGNYTWTLPADAPDNSWVEVTADHGSTAVIGIAGFPAGLEIAIAANATGASPGNERWRFCIARKCAGAWRFGPRGF